MKMIQNKNLIQKIVILLLIVVSFNIVCPTRSQASLADVGGVLLKPIADLLVGLGDAVVQVEHDLVLYETAKDEAGNPLDVDTLVEVDLRSDVWEWIVGIVVGLLVIAAIIGLSILTGGIAGAIVGSGFAVGAIGAVTAGTIITATISGVVVGGIALHSAALGNHYYLPMYAMSPEEIFQNRIPLFNVNFFNPDSNADNYNTTYAQTITNENWIDVLNPSLVYKEGTTVNNPYYPYREYDFEYGGVNYNIYYYGDTRSGSFFTLNKVIDGIKEHVVTYEVNTFYEQGKITERYHGTPAKRYITVSKHDIEDKLNEVLLSYNIYTDLNSFIANNSAVYSDGGKTLTVTTPDGAELKIENYGESNQMMNMYKPTKYTNIATHLQKTISSWYVVLRNVALVLSMSILVYVGIRMMLTSIAAEKAKYKNMFTDWLIGVALLFVMQYIMVFSVNIVEVITNKIDAQDRTFFGLVEVDSSKKDKVAEALGGNEYFLQDNSGNLKTNQNGNYILSWPTNLMGVARLNAQLNRDTKLSYIGYVLVFLILVFYTIFFVFTYLKRVLYMAFLTIIAPMVAMTYPIDKLNDGKAQAFNMWLKEYIFNLIIQPFHLLLYVILISSAMELATTSVLYSLVAIGFMMPAEKLLRKFFGFDKAQTPGFLGGASGAALTMSLVGGLNRFSRGAKPHAGGGKSGQDGKINYSRQKLPGNKFEGDLLAGSSSGIKTPPTPPSSPTAPQTPTTTGVGKSAENGDNKKTNGKRAHIFDPIPLAHEAEENAPQQKATELGPISATQDAGSEAEVNIPQFSDSGEKTEERENINDYLESQGTRQELEDVFRVSDNNSLDVLDVKEEREELESAFELDEDRQEILEKQQEDARLLEEQEERRARRKAIAGAMRYNASQSMRKAAANAISNAPSKILRGGARFVGAGVLGSVGLAAGIASGDPNNLIKMGGAGIAAGNALGAGLANRVGVDSVGKFDAARGENILKEAYGPKEYTQIMNKRLDDEFLKDPVSRNLYKSKFSKLNDDEITAVMERSLKYKDKGLTDDKTIIDLIKTEQREKNDNYILDSKNGIDEYTEALAALIKDVNAPKDIDRIKSALDSDSRFSDSHTKKIIKDLCSIKGYKNIYNS